VHAAVSARSAIARAVAERFLADGGVKPPACRRNRRESGSVGTARCVTCFRLYIYCAAGLCLVGQSGFAFLVGKCGLGAAFTG